MEDSDKTTLSLKYLEAIHLKDAAVVVMDHALIVHATGMIPMVLNSIVIGMHREIIVRGMVTSNPILGRRPIKKKDYRGINNTL